MQQVSVNNDSLGLPDHSFSSVPSNGKHKSVAKDDAATSGMSASILSEASISVVSQAHWQAPTRHCRYHAECRHDGLAIKSREYSTIVDQDDLGTLLDLDDIKCPAGRHCGQPCCGHSLKGLPAKARLQNLSQTWYSRTSVSADGKHPQQHEHRRHFLCVSPGAKQTIFVFVRTELGHLVSCRDSIACAGRHHCRPTVV